MPPNPHRKSLPALSPEAVAALKLPLEVDGDQIFLWRHLLQPPSWAVRQEIAAFTAAALNELLTPAAAPNTCEQPGCNKEKEFGYKLCLGHVVEHEAALLEDAVNGRR